MCPVRKCKKKKTAGHLPSIIACQCISLNRGIESDSRHTQKSICIGNAAANAGNMRLYFHKASSASLRVLLFVRYAADDRLTLVEVDGAPPGADSAFLLPEGDPEALRLGTRDYNAFNPEGRIPVLLLAPGRMQKLKLCSRC